MIKEKERAWSNYIISSNHPPSQIIGKNRNRLAKFKAEDAAKQEQHLQNDQAEAPVILSLYEELIASNSVPQRNFTD